MSQTAMASGWWVIPNTADWSWRAYGPDGDAAGTSATEDEARAKAIAAERELRERWLRDT